MREGRKISGGGFRQPYNHQGGALQAPGWESDYPWSGRHWQNKTRLAVEAARAQSESFADGVYFGPLAALEDPSLIVSPIADAINFSFYLRDQREHWEFDPQREQLLAYLRKKQLLLVPVVLDNVEHLITSALPSLEKQ